MEAPPRLVQKQYIILKSEKKEEKCHREPQNGPLQEHGRNGLVLVDAVDGLGKQGRGGENGEIG